MEEESGELNSKVNGGSMEKIMKRKLKTPSQVVALENFYNEHKYPTESMKTNLAEAIGLSEKQVSGWFCHRRLKDKRLLQEDAFGNGKQDRSSGVIQDLGSGLRQDSCGSTKQGDCFGLLDPKEVESRSNLYGEELTPVGLNYNQKRHFSGDVSETDDSSSKTSSPLQSKNSPSGIMGSPLQSKDISSGLMRTRNYTYSMPPNDNGVKGWGNTITRPSGYLKVKYDVENSAITAVKTKLGRHYREDGPALDVNFQTLPPGAFNLPLNTPDDTVLYCSSSSIHKKSSSHPGVQRQSNLSTKHEASHMDDRLDCWDDYYRPRLKQKSILPPNYKSVATQNYYSKRNDYPGSCENYQTRPKHGAEEMRSDYISDHTNYICNGNLDTGTEPLETWLDNDDDTPKIPFKRDRFSSKPANTVVRYREFLDMEEREPSGEMAKEDEFYGENRRMNKECPDPFAESGKRLTKRVRDEYPSQDYLLKAPFLQIPPHANRIKGSASEMPSSLSEDESAETSFSMD